jgi:hypothetical protein
MTTTEAQISPPPPPLADAAESRSASTDFLQIESIVLNLDASLRVHARAHLFSWTQACCRA